MGSPVATSAINTNRTKVVGTGLVLKSMVNQDVLNLSPEAAKDWQKKTEAEFKLWALKKQNCDALGLNNFYGLQQLALKSWLLSGDVFIPFKFYSPSRNNPYSLRLHVIEADRVRTPSEFLSGAIASVNTEGVVPEGHPGAKHNIHDGVEVDEQGKIVAYYIHNHYPNQFIGEKSQWVRVEAYGEKTGMPNILHVMDSERPDQYRGVPYLSQIIEPLLQLRRYTESQLMAALIQSFFTAWIETENAGGQIPINEVGGGIIGADEDGHRTPDVGPRNENEHSMGPGTVVSLKPGEKIVFGQPNVPTTGFDAFVKTLCKLMGAGLEIPYEVLMKEFNSSYSASRGALLEAWEAIKMRRNWLVDDLCQPTYERWLAEAVARGRIKAPGFFDDPVIREAWCGARWVGPIQGQLDPQKEAKAAILLAQSGIKTYEQTARELGGGDWEENVAQLKRENELLQEARGSRTNNAVTSPTINSGEGDPSNAKT